MNTYVYSSPWIEANDPFLRSSMLALSDGGVLNGVTSTFPLRWSSIADGDHVIEPSGYLDAELGHLNYAYRPPSLIEAIVALLFLVATKI